MSEFSLFFFAYIGPGLSAGAVVVILAVIASIFFAFCAIVWYPLKRMIKRITSGSSAVDTVIGLDDPEDRANDEVRPASDDQGSPLAAK